MIRVQIFINPGAQAPTEKPHEQLQQTFIRHKVGLPNPASDLGNISNAAKSWACPVTPSIDISTTTKEVVSWL